MTATEKLEYRKHLSREDLLEMVEHWLGTTPTKYLGRDYGRPNTSDKKILISACAKDLPVLDIIEIEAVINKL